MLSDFIGEECEVIGVVSGGVESAEGLARSAFLDQHILTSLILGSLSRSVL